MFIAPFPSVPLFLFFVLVWNHSSSNGSSSPASSESTVRTQVLMKEIIEVEQGEMGGGAIQWLPLQFPHRPSLTYDQCNAVHHEDGVRLE